MKKNAGCEFMDAVKMPAPGYPLSKINTLRYPSDKSVHRFTWRALSRIGLAQRDYRKYLGTLEAYAGDASWALSRGACEYIVEFADENPHVERFFRHTFTSDEVFFHTILGNSPFRHRITRSLVYRDWSGSAGDHPMMLDESHVKFFEAEEKVWVNHKWGSGEMLFARKFSDDRLDLVDRIDDIITRKQEQVRAEDSLINKDIKLSARLRGDAV